MKCLIVLGGGLDEKQNLNHPTKLRFEKAVELHDNFDYVICSSKGTYRPVGKTRNITEAEVGKTFLTEQGVPDKKIIKEEESLDTFSNAYYCRLILDRLGCKEFTIITSEFHLPKTKFVFKVVFSDDYKINYISSENGIIDPIILNNRRINEKEVLAFYEKNLFTTYKIVPGKMKTIENYMKNHNPALTGKYDHHHQNLSERVNSKIDKSKPMLY